MIKMKMKCMKYDYQWIVIIIFKKIIQIELNSLCAMYIVHVNVFTCLTRCFEVIWLIKFHSLNYICFT